MLLYIPTVLHVGFQLRSDCYTGKLAYVIYEGHKGELKKSGSWHGWRSKDLEPIASPNDPTEGFVLNRDVGGVRRSYGHNARIEKVRVWDPRGWEFEITVPNLLQILQDTSCSPGKGLEGSFVYSWDGSELVLLSTRSTLFAEAQEYTERQAKSVKAKELQLGSIYKTRKGDHLTFLGRRAYWFSSHKPTGPELRYVFGRYDGKLVYLTDLKSIAEAVGATDARFPELVERYATSFRGNPVAELFLKDVQPVRHGYFWWAKATENGFEVTCSFREDGTVTSHSDLTRIHLVKGQLIQECISCHQYYMYRGVLDPRFEKPTDKELWMKLESGAEIRYEPYNTKKGRD